MGRGSASMPADAREESGLTGRTHAPGCTGVKTALGLPVCRGPEIVVCAWQSQNGVEW
jgi:hypothetical protein